MSAVRALLPRRTAALVEQALVSGAGFAALLLFARELSAAAWGAFAFGHALVLFMLGFQRALVTLPMVAFTAASGWDRGRADWARANATLALVAAALLLPGAVLLPAAGWVGDSLAMACAMVLPLAVHEFARRAAIQEERQDLLAAMGAAYATVLLLLALLPWPSAWQPWAPALAFGGAAGAAACVYRLVSGAAALPRPGPLPRLQGYGAYGGWAVASHLGYSGYNFGVQAILAAVAGPAAVGVFHACRALVQPVVVLIAALDGIDKPRAARALVQDGAAALRRALGRQLAIASALALPYLALVSLVAEPLLRWAYADLYASQRAVVWTWCAVVLCNLVSQPVESGLYVARLTRALFFGRAAAAAASLAAAVPLVQGHGAVGALLAMALGFGLAALFGSQTLFRLETRPCEP